MVTSVTENNIQCLTPPNEISSRNIVKAKVDRWSSQIDGFDYIADPEFSDIEPRTSFFA